MGKIKRKTAATPGNVSRSTRCKTTRRQRLAMRAAIRDSQESYTVGRKTFTIPPELK